MSSSASAGEKDRYNKPCLMSNNQSLDGEIISGIIGKAATVMSKLNMLNSRVWTNKNLTLHAKLKVYQACVLSTVLYTV